VNPGAFEYPRRIGFGDCDPARIFYTPRAFDFCVEAIEAWWESTLSVSWTDLLARRGLEVRVLRAACDFLSPLTVGQVVRVRIRVVENGPTRLTFHATGEGPSGERSFRGCLAAGMFDREREAPVPIPEDDRERIARYEAACGIGEDPPDPGGTLQIPGGRRIFPEGLFARTRRVVYGDCTSAGTVYPPKIFEYAVEATGEWFEEVLKISWLSLLTVRNQGAPAVAASCDFHRPMRAGQAVAMGVRVIHAGRASLGLSVEGNGPKGEPLFDARVTHCFVDLAGGFRSMPIPEEFRQKIQAYRDVFSLP
jgi:acyl-CoA thioesterase FadM